MNRLFIKSIFILNFFFLIISANAQNSWVQKSSLSGVARSGAVSFVVGTNAYVGSGYSGTAVTKDFWKYNPVNNTWYAIADFGGNARQNAVAFVVNDTVYVGLGDNGYPNYTKYKDFWKYNPSTNAWTRKADFGGTARTGAIAFTIGNKGYVGTGADDTGELKDFWEYNPATNTWVQKADFGSDKRKNAVGFAINGKGYVCSGWSFISGTTIMSDVQEYNPLTDKWTEKIFADGSLTKKQSAGCFVLNNKAYLISGNNTNSVVVYDPVANTLSSETNFGPAGETQRNYPVAFAINGQGYAGLGYVMVNVSTLTYQKDLWVLNVMFPPNSPSDLVATPIDNQSVKLNWTDNSNDETYFIIERSSGTNTQFAKIDSVTDNVHTYSVSGLSDSSRYFFRIKAKNAGGYSVYSNESLATTFAWHVPKTPGNLKCFADINNYFNLSWKDNATNDSIISIEWSEGDTTHFKFMVDVQAKNLNATVGNSETKDSTTYYFRIRAKNRVGYSDYSNSALCITRLNSLTEIKAVPVSVNEIDVFWRDRSAIESGYIIERSVNDSLHFEKIDSIGPYTDYWYYKMQFKDNNVTAGINYYYRYACVVKNKRVYCKNIDKATPLDAGNWIPLKSYPGIRAEAGVGFFYNDMVYMGLGGYDGNQFWAMDTKTKNWVKKADLGGNTWEYSSCFILNGKGYACLGSFNMKDTNQVWEYDFSKDIWAQKTKAPMQSRYGQISFCLDNKGYILGGRHSYNTELKDFWEYDGANDTWSRLTDFPGTCSNLPVFVYNNKAYVFYKNSEFWEFSSTTKLWTKVRTLAQPIQCNRGLNLDEKFYLLNSNYNISLTIFWEYDFLKDSICKKTYFPGFADREMIFVQGNKEIYVGCGAGNGYTSEVWLYNPALPANPTNLTANTVTQKQVKLSWVDNATGEKKYILERAERWGYGYGPFSVIDSIIDITSFTDTTILKDKIYFYRVKAKNSVGFSNYSNVAYVMTKVPDKPSFYYISTQMDANWTQVIWNMIYYDGAAGYIIERSDEINDEYTIIDSVPAGVNYIYDKNLIARKVYKYRVKSYNTLGNSEYSTTLRAIPGSLYHTFLTNAKIKDAIYFDPRGYDSDYSRCGTSTQTLFPAIDGNKLIINFQEFSLYKSDTLVIYNGSSTGSPVLGYFTSNNKSTTWICANNPEGSLTVKFIVSCGSYSNGFSGWKAIVKCTDFFPPSGLQAKPVSARKVNLNWIDNTDSEVRFIIERSISDSLHFNAIDSVGADITAYTDTSTVVNTKYYYRVVAAKAIGYSDYSNQATANYNRVGISSLNEDIGVTVYPNPAGTYFNLRIMSGNPEKVTITLSNVLGQPLWTVMKNIDNGVSDIPFDVQKEPDGIYYVQIKTKSYTITKTVLIRK
jgi:hypothetical protein